ncbi:MAG: flagellar hook-length control protein FliK [Alcaligenaceae bacterium]
MNASNVTGLSAIDGLSAVPSAAQSRTNATFVTGKEYVAEVVSCSDENVVTLRVADMVLEGNFERSFVPGQALALKCVSVQGLPLFEIARSGLQETASDEVVLSKTGVLIETYLKNVDTASTDHRLVAINSALLNTTLDAKLIAGELEHSVALSGLFYESHQASYALGRRSLEQLLLEPQNQLGFSASEMIAKQLNTLDQNGFKWAGTVWPGQIMQWAVNFLPQNSQQNGRDPSPLVPSDSVEPEISSSLELDLPNLKKIVANLSWSAETLSIEMTVHDAQTQVILNNKLALFLEAMQAAGQTVKSCTIELNEHD